MALRGIKVLEFAGLAPGPFCGMILADFGATVLRVDKLDSGDIEYVGHGKQSVAVNLKHPEGINIVKKLAKTSDVLLEPFRPGVMEKLGLGPRVLMKDNPKLIYARLTGYGQDGPFSNRAGHDINYLAMSGLLSLFGRKGEKPIFPVNYAADFAGGGLICALGIVLALFERQSSELGQIIDSNMVEGTAYVGSWLYQTQKSIFWGKERGENILDTGSHFYEVYETKDGKYMAVGAIEPQFYDLLLKGLQLRYEEAPQIGGAEDNTLKNLFAEKFLQKTQKEWCEIFDGVDACVTPVLSVEEAPKHPHNFEKGTFAGSAPKVAPMLSRTPGKTKGTEELPKIGEHTRNVLTNLGYSEDQIGDLQEQGVITCYSKSKL